MGSLPNANGCSSDSSSSLGLVLVKRYRGSNELQSLASGTAAMVAMKNDFSYVSFLVNSSQIWSKQ
jgi:hypothetical protein